MLEFNNERDLPTGTFDVTRRTLLGAVLPAALLGFGGLAVPAAFGQSSGGSAAASVTSSIAADLAGSAARSIAGGVVGGLANIALGQVLSAAGIDSNTAINAKLDEILDRLTALQSSVDSLAQKMTAQNSKLSYDLIFGRVAPLITQNEVLWGWYKRIANATSQDMFDEAKRQFRRKLHDYDLEANAKAWNTALQGSFNSTGLIAAWSQAIFATHPLFGANAAAILQDSWNRFDAEQSRTMMFLVEKMNDSKAQLFVPEFLDTWRQNRRQQLALLRGMKSPVDTPFSYISGTGTNAVAVAETVPLLTLPVNTAIDTRLSLMWYTTVFPAIALGIGASAFDDAVQRKVAGIANQICGGSPCDGWTLRTVEEYFSLFRLVNASTDPTIFLAALTSRDAPERFVFPIPQARGYANRNLLWTDQIAGDRAGGEILTRMGRPTSRFTLNDNEESDYAHSQDDMAMLLVARKLRPGEEQNYWYRPL